MCYQSFGCMYRKCDAPNLIWASTQRLGMDARMFNMDNKLRGKSTRAVHISCDACNCTKPQRGKPQVSWCENSAHSHIIFAIFCSFFTFNPQALQVDASGSLPYSYYLFRCLCPGTSSNTAYWLIILYFLFSFCIVVQWHLIF